MLINNRRNKLGCRIRCDTSSRTEWKSKNPEFRIQELLNTGTSHCFEKFSEEYLICWRLFSGRITANQPLSPVLNSSLPRLPLLAPLSRRSELLALSGGRSGSGRDSPRSR